MYVCMCVYIYIHTYKRSPDRDACCTCMPTLHVCIHAYICLLYMYVYTYTSKYVSVCKKQMYTCFAGIKPMNKPSTHAYIYIYMYVYMRICLFVRNKCIPALQKLGQWRDPIHVSVCTLHQFVFVCLVV